MGSSMAMTVPVQALLASLRWLAADSMECLSQGIVRSASLKGDETVQRRQFSGWQKPIALKYSRQQRKCSDIQCTENDNQRNIVVAPYLPSLRRGASSSSEKWAVGVSWVWVKLIFYRFARDWDCDWD